MADICKVCGEQLNDKKTVWAAEGYLYCSKACAESELGDRLDDVAEEVNTIDIGLVIETNSKMSGRNKVAAILCRRDGCTFEEAEYQIDTALQAMEEVGYDEFSCDEIMMDYLGLEPDYLPDLLMLLL